MTPFLQFRMWARGGPPAERALTGTVGALVIVLVLWALIPTSSHSSNVAAGGSSAIGPAAGGASGAQQPGSLGGATSAVAGGGSATAAPGSGAPAAVGGGAASSGESGPAGGPVAAGPVGAPSGPQCPQGATDKGVTADSITVGVVIVDLGQLNPALGIPTFQDQQKLYTALFDFYNKQGGVQCRKLVPKFYQDNVTDPSAEHATCLQIEQDGVFAVLNNLDNPQEFNCVSQRHVPDVFYTSPHTPTMHQYAPFVLAAPPDYDRLIKDYVVGAQQLGLLTGKKIGILEQTCYAEENTDIETDLAAIGFPSNKLSRYNYGCLTTATDTPDQDQSAALQFQRDGVNVVLATQRGAVTGFAQSAQNQGYRPKYVIMNDQLMSLIADNSTPPPSSFDGAVAITTDAEGSSNTPGSQPSPATLECTKQTAALGFPPPDDQHRLAGQLYGSGCDVTKIFVAAASHAPTLERTSLARGLAAAGALDLSYPGGPMHVTDPNVPTGGQSWRPAQWYSACTCWKVTDLRWRPGA